MQRARAVPDSGSKILNPGDGLSAAGRTRGVPAVGSSRYCGLVASLRGKELSRSMSGRLRVAGDPRGVRMIPNMLNLRLRGLCGLSPKGPGQSAGTRACPVPRLPVIAGRSDLSRRRRLGEALAEDHEEVDQVGLLRCREPEDVRLPFVACLRSPREPSALLHPLLVRFFAAVFSSGYKTFPWGSTLTRAGFW